jgi:hypothetical protein
MLSPEQVVTYRCQYVSAGESDDGKLCYGMVLVPYWLSELCEAIRGYMIAMTSLELGRELRQPVRRTA